MTRQLLINLLKREYADLGIRTPLQLKQMTDEVVLDEYLRCAACGGAPYTDEELEMFIGRSETVDDFSLWASTYRETTCICCEVAKSV